MSPRLALILHPGADVMSPENAEPLRRLRLTYKEINIIHLKIPSNNTVTWHMH